MMFDMLFFFFFSLQTFEQTEDPKEKAAEFLNKHGLELEHVDDIVNEVLAARRAAAGNHDNDSNDDDDDVC